MSKKRSVAYELIPVGLGLTWHNERIKIRRVTQA